MEARRTRYGVAAVAVAASLGLHAAVVLVAVRQVGPAAGTPPRPPVILSLVGASLARVRAAASSATDVVAQPANVPPSPAESPVEIPLPSLAPALPPPAALEAQSAVEAGPTPVRPAAADAPTGSASAPPPLPAEVAAVEPRGTLAMAGSAPSQTIAEAVPPAILEALPGAPAPAERLATAEPIAAAAADAPPPLRVAETAAGTIRPVHETAASSVPVAAALPGTPVATGEPGPPREGGAASPEPPPSIPAEPCATGAPVALADAGIPMPARAAEVASVEVRPARETPLAAAPPPSVAASDAEVVVSLEAPAVSAERIRGFVDRYDGGPCFFASVTGTTPTGAAIETFSATVDQVMAFHAAFMGQLGVEPDVIGQRVWSAQCPAVEFLRRTHSSSLKPLSLDLDRRSLRNGQRLSGHVRSSTREQVALFLIAHTGRLENLTDFLIPEQDGFRFDAPSHDDLEGGPFPQIVIAISTESRATNWLHSQKPRSPGDLTSLLAQATLQGLALRATAQLLLVQDHEIRSTH